MTYQITGLAPQRFSNYWTMSEAELAARNIVRVCADKDRGFPCRISLADAEVGESLLLMPFVHHDVPGPYRASGPIFVRQVAAQAAAFTDELPLAFRRRLISVRAYDAAGMMRGCDVVEGSDLDAVIRNQLRDQTTSYVHLHNARPGCFAARVDRY